MTNMTDMTDNIKNSADCVFCKIAAKKIPSNIVYEDADFLAFLSIDPQSPGHTLIIPRDHYRWVWDVPNVDDYFKVANKIAHAQQKAFSTDFILSKIVGEEVHHAHIWIFPNDKVKGDKKDFVGNAEKIIAAIER